MEKTDCFGILQISPEATPREARQAYMRLVKRWHPDRFVDDPGMRESAQEKLKIINAAYQEARALVSSRNERIPPGRFSKSRPVSRVKPSAVSDVNRGKPRVPSSVFSVFGDLVPNRIKRFFSAGPASGPHPHGNRQKMSAPTRGRQQNKDFQDVFTEAVRTRTGAPYRVHKRAAGKGKPSTKRTTHSNYTRVRSGKTSGARVAPVEPVRKVRRVGKIK